MNFLIASKHIVDNSSATGNSILSKPLSVKIIDNQPSKQSVLNPVKQRSSCTVAKAIDASRSKKSTSGIVAHSTAKKSVKFSSEPPAPPSKVHLGATPPDHLSKHTAAEYTPRDDKVDQRYLDYKTPGQDQVRSRDEIIPELFPFEETILAYSDSVAENQLEPAEAIDANNVEIEDCDEVEYIPEVTGYGRYHEFLHSPTLVIPVSFLRQTAQISNANSTSTFPCTDRSAKRQYLTTSERIVQSAPERPGSIRFSNSLPVFNRFYPVNISINNKFVSLH